MSHCGGVFPTSWRFWVGSRMYWRPCLPAGLGMHWGNRKKVLWQAISVYSNAWFTSDTEVLQSSAEWRLLPFGALVYLGCSSRMRSAAVLCGWLAPYSDRFGILSREWSKSIMTGSHDKTHEKWSIFKMFSMKYHDWLKSLNSHRWTEAPVNHRGTIHVWCELEVKRILRALSPHTALQRFRVRCEPGVNQEEWMDGFLHLNK